MSDNPLHDKTKEAVTFLRAEGVICNDLDGAVHQTKSQEATDINNTDMEGQVEYLLESGWTLKDILKETKR